MNSVELENLLRSDEKETTRGSIPVEARQTRSNVFFQVRFWKKTIISIAIFGIGFALSALFYLKNEAKLSSQSALARYSWLVLGHGNQLALDEIGRFLKQIDGISQISYIPAEDAVNQLPTESLLREDLKILGANPLPPSWQIRWSEDSLDPQALAQAEQEIRTFPAVTDVAFDPSALAQIHERRLRWMQIRMVVGILTFVTSLGISILFARSFFIRFSRFDIREAAVMVLSDVAAWSAGVWFFASLIGPVPWSLLLGGLLWGGAHYFYVYAARS